MTPLDPAALALLAERAAAGAPPDHQLSVEQMRERADMDTRHLDRGLPVDTRDRELIGAGGVVPLRVLRPHQPPLGVVVYAHGGGHVTGTLNS